jgi:hypothetical protein
MSKEGVVRALATLSAAYQRELTDPTIALYIEALGDLDDNALMGASLDATVTSKFFPTIAELRERAVFRQHPQGQPPAPEMAWNEVMLAVTTKGRWERPVFSHELIRATLDLTGGYVRLCEATVASEGANRAQFLSTYQRLIQREVVESLPQALRAGEVKQLSA